MSLRGLDAAAYAAAPAVLAELAEANRPHVAALKAVANGNTARFTLEFITFKGCRTVPVEVTVITDHTLTDAEAEEAWKARGGGYFLRWSLKNGQIGEGIAEIDLRQTHI